MAQHADCAFGRLPEELLTHIVDFMLPVDLGDRTLPGFVLTEMRKLRLVCKRFAYLGRILQVVFREFQFRAEPEWLAAMKQTDFSVFAKHVGQVSFATPSYSTAMTKEVFDKIVLLQVVYRHRNIHKIHSLYGPKKHDAYEKYLIEYMAGRLPFTAEETQTGYDKYEAAARETDDLLRSDMLRETWSSILEQFINCYAVQLLEPDFDASGSRHAQPEAENAWPVIVPHEHDQVHKEHVYRRLAAPVGDLLLAASLDSLARAGTPLRRLILDCVMTGDFTQDRFPHLAQLQEFVFRPRVETIGERILGGSDAAADRAAKFINKILQKCNNELVTFSYSGNCPMRWPADEVVALPNIKRIALGSYGRGTIRSKNFRAWMQHMPRLEELELVSTMSDERDPDGWKTIFDAVKDHLERNKPKRMFLFLDFIHCYNLTKILLRQDLVKLDDSIVNFDEATMDDIHDIHIVLMRYMTGISGWDNAATRKWFYYD